MFEDCLCQNHQQLHNVQSMQQAGEGPCTKTAIKYQLQEDCRAGNSSTMLTVYDTQTNGSSRMLCAQDTNEIQIHEMFQQFTETQNKT